MKRTAFLCLFGLCFLQLQSQLSDDFSDGDFSSQPIWTGDIELFIINDHHQLQLNAQTGGTSILCTSLSVPDSVRWEMYINLQFATSATNKLRLFLLLDTVELADANGYYIEIGQNGSADPVLFFSLENGQSFLLGSSTITFDKEVKLHLTILRDTKGTWIFYANTGDNAVKEILRLNDTTFHPAYTRFFCLECYYTATRTDKFVFDNIIVKEMKPDTTPPSLTDIKVIDSTHLELIFSENIGAQPDKVDISIEPGTTNLADVQIQNHKMQIELERTLSSGQLYTCSTSNIRDTALNISGPQKKSFQYIKISDPLSGDIAINEVLFNPKSGGSPYIELYNLSEKYFNCGDLFFTIKKGNNSSTLSFLPECIISPNSFAAFTNDSLSTVSNYPTSDEDAIIESDLPALARDFGSIILSFQNGGVIDSIYYEESYHHMLLNDSRGVALERISPTFPSLSASDWNSASDESGWGTPGLPNSQFKRLETVLTTYDIENGVFSPDGDGHEDYLLIRFSESIAGQLATVRIYDEYGREVAVLSRNELLGNGSTQKWDGTTSDSSSAASGIYILIIEILQETGVVATYKEAVILAAGL